MHDILHLLKPLTPPQAMTFCRAVQDNNDMIKDRWAKVAEVVASEFPQNPEVSADDCKRVYNSLNEVYPEILFLSRMPTKIEFARTVFLKIYYECLSTISADPRMGFLNLGYSDSHDGDIILGGDDEVNRYCIQLYHHLIGSIAVKGRDIVEIGCGRGGGCDYMARYLQPESVYGIDLTDASIDYCMSTYDVDGLSFRKGNAMDIPLEDETCDIVVNVESSHCYPSTSGFFNEVYRILRPGGYFLFSDIRSTSTMRRGYENAATLASQIATSPFKTVHFRDITHQVMDAFRKDGMNQMERWRIAMEKLGRLDEASINYFMFQLGKAYTDRADSWFDLFTRGKFVYHTYILKKS